MTIKAWHYCRLGNSAPTAPVVLFVRAEVRTEREKTALVIAESAKLSSPLQAKAHSVVRFVVISDTHARHELLAMPTGDILVHCGDIAFEGRRYSDSSSIAAYEQFNTWLGGLPYQHKVVIAGNHDAYLAKIGPARSQELLSNAVYLCDSAVELPVQVNVLSTMAAPPPPKGAASDVPALGFASASASSNVEASGHTQLHMSDGSTGQAASAVSVRFWGCPRTVGTSMNRAYQSRGVAVTPSAASASCATAAASATLDAEQERLRSSGYHVLVTHGPFISPEVPLSSASTLGLHLWGHFHDYYGIDQRHEASKVAALETSSAASSGGGTGRHRHGHGHGGADFKGWISACACSMDVSYNVSNGPVVIDVPASWFRERSSA